MAAIGATWVAGSWTDAAWQADTWGASATTSHGSPWQGYEPRNLYAPRWVSRKERAAVVPVVVVPSVIPARFDVDGFPAAIGQIGAVVAQGGITEVSAAVKVDGYAPVTLSLGEVTARGGVQPPPEPEPERVNDDEEAMRWIRQALEMDGA